MSSVTTVPLKHMFQITWCDWSQWCSHEGSWCLVHVMQTVLFINKWSSASAALQWLNSLNLVGLCLFLSANLALAFFSPLLSLLSVAEVAGIWGFSSSTLQIADNLKQVSSVPNCSSGSDIGSSVSRFKYPICWRLLFSNLVHGRKGLGL